jgi:transcriptional antiterminator RfaH
MMHDFKSLCDANVRANGRTPIGKDDAVEALNRLQARRQALQGKVFDLTASFRTHDLMQPTGIPDPVRASTVHASGIGRRWFVAQTKPNGEATAVQEITKHGMHVCAPEVASWSTVHRKDVVRVRPLFPRYVFVGIDPDARGGIDFRTPRLCDGVAGFVQSAGGIAEVKDTAVGDLMFANERRWVDFTMNQRSRSVARRMSYKNPEFTAAMGAIMKAAPTERIRIFLDCFGKRARLLHSADG